MRIFLVGLQFVTSIFKQLSIFGRERLYLIGCEPQVWPVLAFDLHDILMVEVLEGSQDVLAVA